jgi:hypothetical protein
MKGGEFTPRPGQFGPPSAFQVWKTWASYAIRTPSRLVALVVARQWDGTT